MSRVSFVVAIISAHLCAASVDPWTSDPKVLYAQAQSSDLTLEQQKLYNDTIALPNGIMAGALEVIRLNQILMKSIKATKVIDVGLFTGVSALAAALTIPENGTVVAIDVDSSNWNNTGRKYAEQAGVLHKIDVRIHPNNAGVIALNGMIRMGELGTYDFCFIDANKDQYLDYYKKCHILVRPGGIIAIDNVIWGVTFHHEAIHKMNEFINNDKSVMAVMLPIADGVTYVYKL